MAGIYIHIPFCKTRCDYCAFYSTVSSFETVEKYVDRLCREAGERSGFFGGGEVASVYLGGGTPSRLSVEHLSRIFNTLSRNFKIKSDAEITIEVNPDDITPEYATALASLPVNRISMGVQSFSDRLLHEINRRHGGQQAVESYEMLRAAGFGNISLDLIYALPGETLEMWESDLRRMVALRPEHISAYALSYEEGTRLYRRLMNGETHEASDDLYINMYGSLVKILREAGYEHYEISNFALPGRRARHNSSYWTGAKYLGLGAGAHSYDGGARIINSPDVAGYISSLRVPCETEVLSPENFYDEMVMTRLRTCEGISLGEVERGFGTEARAYLLRMAGQYLASGKLEMVDRAGETFLKLTEQGVMISDEIICDLMNPGE